MYIIFIALLVGQKNTCVDDKMERQGLCNDEQYVETDEGNLM